MKVQADEYVTEIRIENKNRKKNQDKFLLKKFIAVYLYFIILLRYRNRP